MLEMMKGKIQFTQESQNQNLICYYKKEVFIYLSNHYQYNTKINKLKNEIENLLNLQSMASLFYADNLIKDNFILSDNNISQQKTISYKELKKLKKKETLNENEFQPIATDVNLNYFNKNNEENIIHNEISPETNHLQNLEFKDEEEKEEENIIYKKQNSKDNIQNIKEYKDINYLSLNLLLKKIAIEENFFQNNSQLIYGFVHQFFAFINLNNLIKRIIEAYEVLSQKWPNLFSYKVPNPLIKLLNMIIIIEYEEIEKNKEIKKMIINLYSNLPKFDIVQSILFLFENNCEKFEVDYLNFLSNSFPHSSSNILIRHQPGLKQSSQKYFSIFSWEDEAIASQLTYITGAMMGKIKNKEIIYANKKNREERAPNVITLLKRFDNLIYFIVEDILAYDESKVRALVIEKWINIAYLCKKMRNFHDCFIIFVALNNNSLKNLKRTNGEIREKFKRIFNYLSNFCTFEGKYINIKKKMEKCVANNQTFIPFLQVILNEIAYIEEHNKYIKDGQLINIEKIVKVNSTLNKFGRFNNYEYSFRPIAHLNILNNLTFYPKNFQDKLEDLAKKLEPEFLLSTTKRNRKRKTKTDEFYHKPFLNGYYVNVKIKNFQIKEDFYKIHK